MANAVEKIFVGQTALILRLDTNIDLTTAATAVIKYIKPDKVTAGQWTAVISSTPEDGIISYTIAGASDLNVSGDWKMWSYVTFVNNNVAPGNVVTVRVYEEGT